GAVEDRLVDLPDRDRLGRNDDGLRRRRCRSAAGPPGRVDGHPGSSLLNPARYRGQHCGALTWSVGQAPRTWRMPKVRRPPVRSAAALDATSGTSQKRLELDGCRHAAAGAGTNRREARSGDGAARRFLEVPIRRQVRREGADERVTRADRVDRLQLPCGDRDRRSVATGDARARGPEGRDDRDPDAEPITGVQEVARLTP